MARGKRRRPIRSACGASSDSRWRKRLADAGLVRGTTIGIDGTTLEANAALRSIVRLDRGEDYGSYLAVSLDRRQVYRRNSHSGVRL
jgi:hypothetical protein